MRSFHRCILEPLVSHGITVDVYVVTYHSPIEDTLFDARNPHLKSILFVPESNTQVKTTIEGLEHIKRNMVPYDRIIILRFDLLYKKPINAWRVPYMRFRQQVLFPWREYRQLWMEHRRVGDAIIVVDHALDALILSLRQYMNHHTESRISMHLAYAFVVRNVATVRFLVEDGFYDSNTSYDDRKECNNPLYVMHARPYHHTDVNPSRLMHLPLRASRAP